MPNLSLARIMYGTNEDFRTSPSLRVPARRTRLSEPREEEGRGGRGSVSPATLAGLLLKTWTALTGRNGTSSGR